MSPADDELERRRVAEQAAHSALMESIGVADRAYILELRDAWSVYQQASGDAWQRYRAAVDAAYAAHRPGAVDRPAGAGAGIPAPAGPPQGTGGPHSEPVAY